MLFRSGATLGNKAYAFPAAWRGGVWDQIFIPLNVLMCILAVTFSCNSRFRKFDIMTKVQRLFAFCLPYVTSMSPCFYRAVTALESDDAAYYYWCHFQTAAVTAVVFVAHYPEVLMPGYFDVYLHSHQIFHVLVSLGTYYKISGLVKDLHAENAQQYDASINAQSLWLLLAVAIINGSIVGYKIYRMVQMHNPKKDDHQK